MLQNELDQLSSSLKFQDWFDSVGLDQFNRPVIYVKYMNLSVLTSIPDTYNNLQVLCNFIQSKNVNRESFVERFASASSALRAEEYDDHTTRDMSYLTKELDKLEKVCGTLTLGDIFFEAHDKDNAISNFSVKFPDVRKSIDKLYAIYGFDVIYEQLEL